jgi:hypothetical protein
MNSRSKVISGFLILITLVLTQFGFKLNTNPLNSNIQTASLFNSFSEIDTFDFDREEFESEMKELHSELKKLRHHKFNIKFDSKKFKEEMELQSSDLKNLRLEDFHIDVEFDSEEFRENMKELEEELRDQKITFQDFHFDASEFKKEMEALKEGMKDIEINLTDLNLELGKLDGFMEELKTELKNDGLIKDENENIDLEMDESEMRICGEKVPEELFRKYKELYEEYFGKNSSNDMHIKIH